MTRLEKILLTIVFLLVAIPTILWASPRIDTPLGFVTTITITDAEGDTVDVTSDGKLQCQG